MRPQHLQSLKWKGLYCIFIFMFCAISSLTLMAQTTQQFTGHVLDSTGAVVPGAQIVVHNQNTGVDTKTVTTGAGVYTVPYLIPGTYTITAIKTGFKTENKTDILLDIDQTSTIDLHLSIGTTSEEITVNASAVQIELTKGDRGEIIDSERVAELPLEARNPYELFSLSPGTHDFSNAIYPRPFDDVTSNQYANGSPQVPSLSLDGVSNDSGKNALGGFSTNPGIVPSVDAVQEYKVVLGAADASYGQGGGASIDVALKTGSNRLHGVLDGYKRGSWLDTYSWTSKWSALSQNQTPIKASHNRVQYSLEFDGPVVIPHLFNGKNKLFFTVSYEYMKETLPDINYSYANIPNPAWLTGDFSTAQFWDSTTQSLEPLKIYDVSTPLQTVTDPNDGKKKTAHAQFPGNMIPTNRFDPVGYAMLKYLSGLTPNNNPGPGVTPYTQNWKNLQVEDDIWKNGLVKVDYVLSDADRLSFRWSGQGRWQSKNMNPGWDPSSPNYALINDNSRQVQPKSETGAIQWTHTFSPKLLLDVHATLMTQADDSDFGPNVDSPSILKQLGFAASFYGQIPNQKRFPQISWGGTSIGVSNLGSSWHTHALDFLPTLSWVHGGHTIRTGFDVQLQQASNPAGGSSDSWSFSNNFTNEFYGFSEAPGWTSGSAYASGLLGYLNSGSIPYSFHDFESQHYFAPWVQDDWKIAKNLTLNLGFRWDFQVPRTVRNNSMNGAFDTSVINPVSSMVPFAVLGGPTYAGVNGQPRSAYAMNKYEWQPRIGFAYAVKPNISLRGFVAKNYPIQTGVNGNFGFSSSTGYQSSVYSDGVVGSQPYTLNNGQGGAPGLTNPYAGVNKPVGASLGYLSNIGNSWTWYNPKYRGQSLWNYSLTLEAAVTKRDVVSAGYVGNYAGDIPEPDNINHPSAAFYQQCNGEAVGWSVNVNGATVPTHQICDNQFINGPLNTIGYTTNPFKGLAPFNDGAGYYAATYIIRADQTRPYFGWYDLTENGATNNGRNWYNAVQVTAKHQATNNLSLYFNYTHATNIFQGALLDTTYRVIQRQVSTTNQIKHAINVSGVAYLPFGRNRQYFSNVNRLVDEAINGWEISPLMSWYSGFPWRPGGTWEWNTSAPMGVQQTTLPADGSHNFRRLRGVTPCVGYRNSDTGAITPSPAATAAGCSSIQYVQAGSYAVPHNVVDFGVTQPGAIHFDMAVAKNFSVPGLPKTIFSDNTRLQLRLDMLNVLNHANWDDSYNGTPSSIDWGTISKGPAAPNNTPRYLQLSFRLNW